MFLSNGPSSWHVYSDEDVSFELFVVNFTALQGELVLRNKNYEFLTIEDQLPEGFAEGYIFKDKSNEAGTINIKEGIKEITGTNTDFRNLNSGDKIVLVNKGNVKEGDRQYEIVEIASRSNENAKTSLDLVDLPEHARHWTSIGYKYTPVARISQVDITRNPIELDLTDSTASNNTFRFEANDTIIIESETGSNNSVYTARIQEVRDLSVNSFDTLISRTVPSDCLIVPAIQFKYDDTSSNFYRSMEFNDVNYMVPDTVIKSKSNDLDNSDKILINLDLSSQSEHDSPFVDIMNSKIVAYENKASSNVSNEYLPNIETGVAKYISKQVQLDSEIVSEGLLVKLDAYKPEGSEIEVWAKFKNEADSTLISARGWSKLEISEESDSQSSSSVGNIYDVKTYNYDVQSTLQGTQKQGTVNTTNGNSTVTGTDTAFSTDYVVGDLIKIVLTSDIEDFQIARVKSIANNTSMEIEENIRFSEGNNLRHYKVNNDQLRQSYKNPYPTNSDDEGIVTYYNISGEKFEGFSALQLKIVLYSDSGISPRVYNYRAIASA